MSSPCEEAEEEEPKKEEKAGLRIDHADGKNQYQEPPRPHPLSYNLPTTSRGRTIHTDNPEGRELEKKRM